MTDPVLLMMPDDPHLTPAIRVAIGGIVTLFAAERMNDAVFYPTLIAPGSPHMAVIEYLDTPQARAAQVLVAACTLISLHPATTAFVLAHDVFMRDYTNDPVRPTVDDDLPAPSEDPAAIEALGVFVARRTLFQVECKSTQLPYGRNDDGLITWQPGRPWITTPEAPIDLALRTALRHGADDVFPERESVLDQFRVEIISQAEMN